MTDANSHPSAIRSSTWSDLPARAATGLGLGALGLGAVVLGGPTFAVLVSICVGLLLWELAQICGVKQSRLLGAASATLFLVSTFVPSHAGLLLLLLPLVWGLMDGPCRRAPFAGFGLLIMVASAGLLNLRADLGAAWVVWLLLTVVATDVGGYFAGKTIGGPKFWPSVSPKKTWSGTIGGWVAAMLVGLVEMSVLPVGAGLILLSLAVAIVSQAGDLAQSALKRSTGVKDSSKLLPGHGGFFDRFDGHMAAILLVMGVHALGLIPTMAPGG